MVGRDPAAAAISAVSSATAAAQPKCAKCAMCASCRCKRQAPRRACSPSTHRGHSARRACGVPRMRAARPAPLRARQPRHARARHAPIRPRASGATCHARRTTACLSCLLPPARLIAYRSPARPLSAQRNRKASRGPLRQPEKASREPEKASRGPENFENQCPPGPNTEYSISLLVMNSSSTGRPSCVCWIPRVMAGTISDASVTRSP